MKKFKRLLATAFVVTLMLVSAFSASAAESNVIKLDFNNTASFASMGDLDIDGTLNSSDLIQLRKILLEVSTKNIKYADCNNDSKVNILDLIRLKKNLINQVVPMTLENGKLILNGTVYYTGELVSLLKANTEYQISYDVISDNGITVTVNGAKAKDAVYNSGKGTKSFSHILKTGSSLTENNGLELSFSGKGTITNVIINEIVDIWSDGDSSEQGGNDIF